MPVIPQRRSAAMKRAGAIASLALALALSALTPAAAQGVVIYRCTDASGALTIQNGTPCPKGSKQERRVIDATPTASAPFVSPPPPPPPVRVPPALRTPPTAPPPAVLPPAEEPESAIADADRLPPPWLYECRTDNNSDSYLSEDGEPKPRCVTLNTTGLSGVIEDSNRNTAACEMKIDQCQRVPDGALCDAWRRRVRAAESALRFGASEDRAKAQAELQRLTRAVRESTCGKP